MTVREQLFTLLRNLRWIIVLSVFLSALLYLPDQIRELYRIAADDAGWVAFKEFLAIALVAIAIWLGAFQLTTESRAQMPSATGRLAFYIRLLPVILGALPIVAAMAGQLASRPDDPRLAPDKMNSVSEVGSIFRIQDQALASERLTLVFIALGLFVLLVVFLIFAWRVGSTRALVSFSRWANEKYFTRLRFLATTIVFIIVLTTAFILVPDAIAQFVGSFGVIALFAACVIGVTIHLSLKTIQHSIPFLPLIFGSLFLIACFAESDNHELRTVSQEKTGHASPRVPAVTAFQNWLNQPSRVAEAARLGEYPVFIVAAQGGGIYAAHNAARFLARMQDLCPAFRQHLFAISAVSGGSVGSATFAAALHAEKSPLDAAAGRACPKIAQFLAGTGRADDIDAPGPVEQRVARVLATDFLSPLIAGFLFSDFTQLFSPIAVPFLDRARFLEYTLENAADRMLKGRKDVGDQTNLLKADYQSHWTPDNNMPALLLNTTDVGSGKRVVMSPFDIDPAHPKDRDLCIFANLKRQRKGTDQTVESSSIHIPLSTAAFASARFPWVTPASTVTLNNDCITAHPMARLVDGGYVENSGVETALDLIEKLKSVQGTSDVQKFRIYLLSLVSGDFGDHGAFTVGELMEPVRALLSTRSSRTYIALNRAARDDLLPPKEGASSVRSFQGFARTDLTGLFYSLPLGWTLSEKTGDIVSVSSGRFWDCLPKADFNQSRSKQSNADCLQIKVFHLLNGSVKSAFQALKDSNIAEAYVSALDDEQVNAPDAEEKQEDETKRPKVKIKPDPLLACYESKWVQARSYARYRARVKAYEQRISKPTKDNQSIPEPPPPYRESYLAYFQAEQIKALLEEWDGLDEDEKDPRILAYILGSVSYDSAEFTRKSENFSFSSVTQVPSRWRKRIDEINAALLAAGKQAIDVASLLDRPREFTNFILGYEGNDFGNRPGTDDGWDFRPRGMYQLVGREQYQAAQDQIQGLKQLAGLDLLAFPEALWNTKISAKVTFAHFRTYPYRGGTMFELLKDRSLNWNQVRALQTDMDHGPDDQARVLERSEMFLDCIKETSSLSERTWLKRLLGP
jgi:predicted chitinase